MNGLVVKVTGLAPNIDEPLLGARLTTKKKLELGTTTRHDRQARAAGRRDLVHKCIAEFKSPTYNAILDNSNRSSF